MICSIDVLRKQFLPHHPEDHPEPLFFPQSAYVIAFAIL